jgi:hypothetical protein
MSMPPNRSTTPAVALSSADQSVTSASQECARADLVNDLLLLLGFEADQRDLHALCGQALGKPGADAARRTGDEHDLAVDVVLAEHNRCLLDPR